jgi:hypothetical protein
MHILCRLTLVLMLGCCAVALALSPGIAAAAPSGDQLQSITADPLYQASPISSAVRSIVLCKCQWTTCPQSGGGGQLCGGDPETFCRTCHCVIGGNGTHYCAQDP